MVAESHATVRVERFTGHMGMFNLHHLQVHLRDNLIRRQGGLRPQECLVSEDAEFLDAAPGASSTGSTPSSRRTRVRELLEVDDDRYWAVLSARTGCANSGLLAQQVLAYMQQRAIRTGSGYADRTNVARVIVGDDRALVHAGGRHVAPGTW